MKHFFLWMSYTGKRFYNLLYESFISFLSFWERINSHFQDNKLKLPSCSVRNNMEICLPYARLNFINQ